MSINQIMRANLMVLDSQATSREGLLKEMVNQLVIDQAIDDPELFYQAILEREAAMSTGFGNGLAIPHAKSDTVKKSSVVFARSKAGIDFNAIDGEKVHLIFMIAAEAGSSDAHLAILAKLSKLLLNEHYLAGLKIAQNSEQIAILTSLVEQSLEHDDSPTNQATNETEPYLIAVTACPTGIAHTYIAAESLAQAAENRGLHLKIETKGASGTGNPLTAEDIKKADAVIVATSKQVPMNRFDGKPLLQVDVAKAINQPDDLLDQALAGNLPTYQAKYKPSQEEKNKNNQKSAWASFYNDLMAGISSMLAFVIAGGLILALSFALEPYLGSDSLVFTALNDIGSQTFAFLIPVMAGYISFSIADRPGLVAGFTGGALATSAGAGFLGGIVAGFLAGYTTNAFKKLLAKMPTSLDGIRTILLYPFLSTLAVGFLMVAIINPIFTGINNWVYDYLNQLGMGNLALLGALLGSMMAIDMGGPFNKAAYAFAIGVFTDTGQGHFMAAVMAGGMVPPLAIAFATCLFKNKFTESERSAGLTNIVLGLSFITEGAIPYAATDPLRVIGSSLVGSAIAGGLSQLWQTSIPAPHGGIFTILALGTNRWLLVAAIAIGSLISGLLLGLSKTKND